MLLPHGANLDREAALFLNLARFRDEDFLFGGELFEALQDFVLEREDMDRVPAANVFAEAAPGAFLFVDGAHAEEVIDAVGVAEAEGIEGANVDAELAAGPNALFINDDGLWPLVLLEGAADIAERIENRFRRADEATRAAIDAERRVDNMQLVALARDRVRRAALRARGAANTGLDNRIGQVKSLALGVVLPA